MARKDPLVPFGDYDLSNAIAGIEEIRKYNPQRYEIEMLTAIVLEDVSRQAVVGYKDTSVDDVWVRGHMPGMPLMPGVLMCEAAAQLASYYVQKNDVMGVEMMGFGGMDKVRFRGPVRPGYCLIVQCRQVKVRRRALVICEFMGFVDENLVVEGEIYGIPLPAAALRDADAS